MNKYILLPLLVLIIGKSFCQDVVKLSNGLTLEGQLTEINKEKLSLKTNSEEREILMNDVYSLVLDNCDISNDTTIILADSKFQDVPKGGNSVLQTQWLSLCQGDIVYLWGSAEFLATGSTLGTLEINIQDDEGKTMAKPNVRTHGRRGSPEVRDQMSVFYILKIPRSGKYNFNLKASNSGGSIGDAQFLFDRFQIHVLKM